MRQTGRDSHTTLHIIAAYGAFLAWMLSTLYEAPILYQRIEAGLLPYVAVFELIFGIFLGLASAWSWMKTPAAAVLVFRLSTGLAACAALSFFFCPLRRCA